MINDTINNVLPENFSGTKNIYDTAMRDNIIIHDMIYPHVFGENQYIGQFSDNNLSELILMGETLNLACGSNVLDIGAGRGRVATMMAKHFGWRVTGIDLAEVPIKQAIANSKTQSNLCLNFIHANLYEHTFEFIFDGIYATGAFCHFNAEKLFKHCYHLLRPQGRLTFMERIRLGSISSKDWQHLTTDWCCPYVYTLEEYQFLLKENGFTITQVIDLNESFRLWQERSVIVRKKLKEDIIQCSSEAYYRQSLAFAEYENDVTRKGLLGYICMTAEK